MLTNQTIFSCYIFLVQLAGGGDREAADLSKIHRATPCKNYQVPKVHFAEVKQCYVLHRIVSTKREVQT